MLGTKTKKTQGISVTRQLAPVRGKQTERGIEAIEGIRTSTQGLESHDPRAVLIGIKVTADWLVESGIEGAQDFADAAEKIEVQPNDSVLAIVTGVERGLKGINSSINVLNAVSVGYAIVHLAQRSTVGVIEAVGLARHFSGHPGCEPDSDARAACGQLLDQAQLAYHASPEEVASLPPRR